MAYAVHAMLQLARADSDAPVPCSQLAHEGKMPERFLLQILRSLVTHGLLHSTRGVDGGYVLARPADEISLMDIFDAFDNPLIPSVPALEKLSDETRDELLEVLNRASSAARRELKRLTMADLLHADALVAV
jgi:Rrf2 family protein